MREESPVPGRSGLRRVLARLTATAAVVLSIAPAWAADEPPGCDTDHRENCLYETAATYATAYVDTVLTDAARGGHVVPLRVYYPLNAPGARAVIVWHHGGAVRYPNSAGVYSFGSIEHAKLFAAAGYVVALIDRTPAKTVTASQLTVCKANGATTVAQCQAWVGWHELGPQNTLFVVNYLAHLTLSRLPGFTGTLDTARVVVGGFSGGTELVLKHAGATQTFIGAKRPSVPVPGAVAFIAAAPRGPNYAGFTSGFVDGSFETIGTAPFLYLLARSENPGEATAHGGSARTPAFFNARPGGKVMSWDTNDTITHVNLDLSSCTESAVQTDHCTWSGSFTLAFLDSYVGHRQEATDWLASDAFRILTGGAIEIYNR
jgi:hypothetical protein